MAISMTNTFEALERLESGALDRSFTYLYGGDGIAVQKARYCEAVKCFEELFGAQRPVRFFSAPGRTEVGGNHTDHQHGRVLAAGVNLDVIAVASPCQGRTIRIQSKGFPMDTVSLDELEIQENEKNTAAALIRGICARFLQLGYHVGGFDAYTTSNVLKGSGLSSSAAFEVLVGTILNYMYNEGKIPMVEIAKIGQYAENVYFGKPSGLMDQTASAVGGFVTIDFEDPARPVVEKISFDFEASGYALCIVDTGGNHADLTGEYAAVPQEMRSVAALFGREVLRQVDPAVFFDQLPRVREACGDRAALRAIHFFGDNERVIRQVAALRSGDFDAFKEEIVQSGQSSYMYLQNVYTTLNVQEQGLSIALAVTERLLRGKGAWRVHGGGFAGTIQAFVPNAMVEAYKESIEKITGCGSCYLLSIRPVGGVEVLDDLTAGV